MKHIRRILSFLLVMMMVFNLGGTVFAAKDTVYEFRVEFDKETVAPGETVTMSVYGPAGPCNASQIIVHYDSTKLEHVSQELISTDYKRNVHNAERNEVDFGIVHMEAVPIKEGIIGKAVFRAKDVVGTASFDYETYFYEHYSCQNPSHTVGPTSIRIAEPAAEGYQVQLNTLTAGATVGGEALVQLNVASGNYTEYNAYDITLSYDAGLRYVRYDDAADPDVVVTDDSAAHTLHIVGYGKNKMVDTPVLSLSFAPESVGTMVVSATAAKVDNAVGSVNKDAPDADLSQAMAEIPVSAYDVPVTFTGNAAQDADKENPATVTVGTDYTFRIHQQPNVTYTVTAGYEDGSAAEVVDHADGSYTVKNVQAALTITVNAAAETYPVTVEGTGKDDFEASGFTAAFGQDYTFRVNRNSLFTYTVTAAVNGRAVTPTVSGDSYTIAGTEINGNVVITVDRKLVDPVPVTIHNPEYVEGAFTAKLGEDYTFTVKDNAGLAFKVTVKNALDQSVVEYKDNGDGTYTVPNVSCPLDITVESNAKQFTVSVTGTGAEDVTADKTAQYGSDYSFTVAKAPDFLYALHVTVGGTEYTGYAEQNGTYTISGKDITGNIVIAVEKSKPAQTVEIKFLGNGAADAVGEPNAAMNEPYTFTITRDPAYDYTVEAATIADSKPVAVKANENGSYTIENPSTGIAVTITKTLKDYKVTTEGTGAGDVTAASTAKPNTDYTFTVKKNGASLYNIYATVGGEKIQPVEGQTQGSVTTYTIPGEKVTGDIVITAEKIEGSRITITGTGKDDVAGYDGSVILVEAHKPYTFTLNKQTGCTYDVQVTRPQGSTVEFTDNGDGTYTVPDPSGNIFVQVTKTAIRYDVTVTGSGAGDVTAEDQAQHGTSFVFTVKKAAGYDYAVTAQVAGQSVALSENAGTYTIAADQVIGAITIHVEKKSAATIDVKAAPFLTVDNKVVQLVTATTNGTNALTYGGEKMFWSEKYNAYCWLVVSAQSVDQVLAEARNAVAEAADPAKVSVSYGGDVNMTGFVDINDAQLTYNIYNANYDDFTMVSMEKFLRADVNGSGNVDVADATAIVNTVTRR